MIAAVAILATLVAESLAFYTVAELVAVTYPDGRSAAALDPFVLALITLVAFALPRLAAAAPRGRTTYAASGVVTFVVIYGAFRVEFAGDLAIWDIGWIIDYVAGRGVDVADTPRPVTGAVIIVLAWARGTWRSLSGVEFETTPRQLAFPAGIVIVASILGSASGHSDLIARGAVAFFAVAFVALAFSQSALSGATFGDIRAGSVTTSLLAGSAFAAIAGVLVAGGAFGVLGGPVADAINGAIQVVLFLTVSPIVIAGEWFVGLFDLQPADFRPRQFVGNQSEQQPDEEGPDRGIVERTLLGLVRALGLGAGLVILIGLILAVAGRWRQYRRPVDAVVEVSSTGSLKEDVASLLGGLFHRGHAGARPGSSDPLVRLYVKILDAARDRGRDRAPGATPAEFAPVLRLTFADPVTDDVTHAFEVDVYGSREPSPGLVRDYERRWEQRSD